MARGSGGSTAALAQETFDQPVFQAVEGDDGKAATGLKHMLGGRQPALELLKLFVQMDPDRLEGPRRGVLLHPGMMPERLANDRGKLACPLDWARGDDRARNPARLGLLAIMIEHVRDLVFVGTVDEVGCALAVLAHAHVERTVGLEGEAALGQIELHRGDADIEGDSVHLVDAVLR